MKSDSEIIRWMIICTVVGLTLVLINGFTHQPFSALEYVVLITAWCISVRKRVVATRIKILFTILSALLLFHWYIKDLKYNAFVGDSTMKVRIYLWYCYYIPLIFIPVFSYVISDCIGVRSAVRRARTKTGLYTASAILFLMVITNNFHQFVFKFKGEINEKYYSYNIGYYIIFAWVIALFIMTLYNITSKYLFAKKIYHIFFIMVPLYILLAYVLLSAIGGKRLELREFITIPNIFCVCIIWFWEICLQTGLIRSNYKYDRIFEKTSIPAEITDERGRIIYSVGKVEGVNFERSGEDATGKLTSDGRIIRATRIKGGYIYWLDDLREIVKLEDELRDVREHLSEEHEILVKEKELREEELRVVTRNKIYDMISDKVYPQLCRIESLIGFLETSYDDRLLAALCILTVYIKRVSNMLILAESDDKLDIRELELAIKESCDYIKLYGAECEMLLEARGKISSDKMIQMYDEFEYHIEKNIENLSDVKVELTGTFGTGGDVA
jgi:hypothetical protein